MSLIDQTYFTGKILIPNLANYGSAVSQGFSDELGRTIAEYEPEYLKGLLGVTLYNAFMADLALPTHETRFVTLRGKIVDDENRISPIAYYIWFQYRREHVRDFMPADQQGIINETVSAFLDNNRSLLVWNRMAKMSQEIQDFLYSNTDFPEFSLDETTTYNTLNYFGI